MYDYGARMLMPDLGRWGVMDAMSEKYARWSPYNYAINNPVMVIDPDGNDAMFASGEAAQFAFRAYVATMSTSTETSGGNVFTGLGSNPFDWVKGLDGKWRYDADITTLEKAKRTAGITGFAKNGTVFSNVSVDGGSISAYAQFNKGGSITKLGADDLVSMKAIVDALPMSLGGSWTTWWTHETFQIFTGGINETDPGTMKKVLPGDKLETNNMFEYIFWGYGRNTRLDPNNFMDAFIQFGLDVEGIGNPVGSLSGSEPVKSDTFGIWDRQASGVLRNSDGSPFGLKYKNVRGEGLSKGTVDSLNKAIIDSNNYWNKQLRK